MSHEIVRLRHAFEVEGRLPRRKAATHHAWREVAVRVPVLDASEAPPAVVVTRPLDPAGELTRASWFYRTEGARAPDALQGIPLRSVSGRLVAPVLAPDMVTFVAPRDLDALLSRLPPAKDAIPYAEHSHWPGYPGALRRVPHTDDDLLAARGRVPPSTPLHLCVDAGSLRDVADGACEAADTAFRAGVDGLCVIDGALWQPCCTPVLAIAAIGAPRVVMPGIDALPAFHDAYDPFVAAVDPRASANAGRCVRFTGDVDVPWADTAALGLLLLHAAVGRALAQALLRDVPREALPLVDAIDGVPDALASGEDPEVTRAAVMQAAGAFVATGAEAGSTFEQAVERVGIWLRATEADLAGREVAGRVEPSMEGFRP